MTDAEQKLCRKIAEAEGLSVSSNGHYVEGRLDDDGDIWYVSLYLTDPAETVRMSKELVKAEWCPSYLKDDTGEETWWWHSPLRAANRAVHAAEHERDTAEAYKAMLEGKAKGVPEIPCT